MNRDVQPLSKKQLAELRLNYSHSRLDEGDVAADPIAQFHRWMSEAIASHLREPNAMTLATTDDDGAPDARIVLLKGVDENGFTFFTNYESAKGRQLENRARAALVFWNELERQIRVRGRVEKVSEKEATKYFKARPRDSQLGAWASTQSEIIPNREWLEQRFEELKTNFAKSVPRPPHWGGYRVVPIEVEFWQGRSSRLHDRIHYRRDRKGWIIERLSP